MKKPAWILIGIVILSAGGFLFYQRVLSDPKKTAVPQNVISSDPSAWDKEMVDSLKRLPDEDKRHVAAYLMRAKMAETFGGGKNVIPEGLTLGRAIEEEKKFESDQQTQDAEAKALQAKVQAEKAVTEKKINGLLTVALVSKGFQTSDFRRGIVSDAITIELALQNKSDKDIAGVKGTTVFKDMFGDTIKQVNLSYDEGIPAGKSVTWSGTINYNQFESNDMKLRTIDQSKLKFSFVPIVVIFSDGTKIEPTQAAGQ